MNKRTRQLYVVSPGFSSGAAFVTSYEINHFDEPAEVEPVEQKPQAQRVESNKTDWAQAVVNLPKVLRRLVRQVPSRQAA